MKVFADGKKQEGPKKEQTNDTTEIKKVIAVMSGKGGVGKSTVTSLLASVLSQEGFKVGLMDADIKGPSIPKLFGKNDENVCGDEMGIYPIESKSGIKLMSINFMLEDKEAPVIWRGAATSSTVKQFFSKVHWGELDYLLIDLPPGTGDIPLTMMQSIPLDGLVVVSTPTELVGHIVTKSLNMAHKLEIDILGLIENMSYYKCEHCGEKTYIFGEGKTHELAEKAGVAFLADIPMDPLMVQLANAGEIEFYPRRNEEFRNNFAKNILEKL